MMSTRNSTLSLSLSLTVALVLAGIISLTVSFATALLALAATGLVGTLTLLWRSLISLTEDKKLGLEEALSLAAPNTEEEQKRAVLRTLRDLEYERSVGKLAEKDYRELSQRYRTEAKHLLQKLDEQYGPARKNAEVLLQHELVLAGLVAPTASEKASSDSGAEDNNKIHRQTDRMLPGNVPPRPQRACERCGARAELTETQCPACQSTLAAQNETLCASCPAQYSSMDPACPVCGVPKQSSPTPSRDPATHAKRKR